MIQVQIVNVYLTPKGEEFVVLLRGDADPRTLPISIGQLEAQSIAIRLYHIEFPRPLTHDLFKSAIERLGAKVTKVVIHDLVNNTFYGKLILESNGETMEIDSRPSDAIAIALRFEAPMFIEEKVLDEAGVIMPASDIPEAKKSPAGSVAPAEPLSTLDRLKLQLGAAIAEERYEEAARLRDEINKLSNSN
jgi:uncharacterized protein